MSELGRAPSGPNLVFPVFGAFGTHLATRLRMRNGARLGLGLPRMAIGLFGMLSALAIHPTPARACGGFFCDQPGGILGSQPIAQTGENVLFRVDPTGASGSTLEAHIQIFYTGPAAQFSWTLPIAAAPRLPLPTGSDTVFSRVAAATAPTFKVNYSTEGTCRAGMTPPYSGSG